MKYYGVCTVTSEVTFLGEFDNPDAASKVAYEAAAAFIITPMSENDLLTLLLNAAKCLNL